MRLEDEIRQVKGFSSEQQKALVNILFTHGWVTERFREYLRPFGLTQQQYNVLRILRGSQPDPMSTSCIRVRLIDKMSDVSRIVDRLCKKELVVRVQSPVDRRLVDVRISEKGLGLLSRMDDEELDQNTIVNLTNEELRQFNTLLDKLRG